MRVMLAAVIILGVFVCGGCQEGHKAPAVAKTNFPPQLAGVWEESMDNPDAGYPWAMVLTEDGRLEEIRIRLAAAILKPDQVVKIKMRDGQYSTFDVGPAYVDYVPETRTLTIAMEIKRFQIKYADALLEGNARYAFTGVITEDGKSWMSEFSEEFDYGPRFPQDKDPNGMSIPMRFEKRADKNK